METNEIIKICKDRGELDFLYKITEAIAMSDSIGEGYSYCGKYTPEQFNNAEKHIQPEEFKKRGFKDEYCQWLEYGGVPIYELYLYQIGVLKNTDTKSKHLRFDVAWAAYNNVKQGHPQDVMKELGISYQHSTPQSVGAQWCFWNCENVPDELPPYLEVVDWNPMEMIGYGLSQQDAERIRDYKKLEQ